MMNKKDIKTAKKRIKLKNMSKWAHNVDKYCKITKLKIKSMNIIEETETSTVYKVTYKMGANLINPLTWVIIVMPSLLMAIIGLFLSLWAGIKSDCYTTTLKIKK